MEENEEKENLRLWSGRRRRKVKVPLSSPVSGPSLPSNCLLKKDPLKKCESLILGIEKLLAKKFLF